MKNHRYIIADHTRAICMMITDGVMPSGKQRGYILRRLMRRLLSSSLALNIDINNEKYFKDLIQATASIYNNVYDISEEQQEMILNLLNTEAKKYNKAIQTGQKEWEKVIKSGTVDTLDLPKKAFDMYQSLGVPLELSEDILDSNNTPLDIHALNKLIENHQQLSNTTSTGQFKSGLGESNETTTQMHTATHILHSVLRGMYGEDTRQMGSAITTEKARFDFSCDQEITNDLNTIEIKVNDIINLNLTMKREEVPLQQAREMGAIGLFGEKYGEIVSVYTLSDSANKNYSIEFCGGPHIMNTKEIKNFKIQKIKSLGQGVKRIEFTV
ncbi:MAG: alanine--tRNA ligase-related protein [Patescibacteria group bacterium]